MKNQLANLGLLWCVLATKRKSGGRRTCQEPCNISNLTEEHYIHHRLPVVQVACKAGCLNTAVRIDILLALSDGFTHSREHKTM